MSDHLLTFLENFRPDGWTTFVGIVPDGTTVAETFNGADPTAPVAWITAQNKARGVYFTVNPTPQGLRKKPEKSDLTEVAAVWADIDPRDDAGEAWNAERERLEALADELHALDTSPTFIVDSGNGIQPVWMLADPIEASDEYRQAAESLCEQIEAALGAKGTHNVDRLLRVPGTRNFPSAKKRALGRGETRSRLLRWTWRRYDWGELDRLAEHLSCTPPRHAVPHERPQPRPPLGEIALPDDAPEPIEPERLAELKAKHPDVFDLASYDGDQSRQDLALANVARHAGWSQMDAWRLLIAVRDDKKAYRRDYVERTVALAYTEQPADDDAPAWADPVDIIGSPEMVGWPELMTECFPDPLYRYVWAESERMNVDPCALSVHVLAAAAGVCSDAWRVKPKCLDHWTQQPRIWACMVKDVGQRGTDTIRSAFWPTSKIEEEFYEKWLEEEAAWQARQAERKKNDKTPDPRPAEPRLTTQDTTVEAASQILANGNSYSKLTFKSDELVTFFGGTKRFGNDKEAASRALWLEGYDGGPHRIDRIIRGKVVVPNWSIVVAGNIQVRKLAEMARNLIDDGLLQRFIVVHSKPLPPLACDDVPYDTGAGRAYSNLIRAIYALRPAKNADGKYATAYFDEGARAVREQFMRLVHRLQHDHTLPIIIRETASKWSGLIARIALIFHIVDLADRQLGGETLSSDDLCRVTVPTVTRAASYIRRVVLPNLFRLGYETMPEEGSSGSHARWIANHILTHSSERIRAREIGRAYRQLRGKPKEIEQVMEVLCDAGWARAINTRHDSLSWAINPDVHRRFKEAAETERQRREAVKELIRKRVSEL